MADIFAHLFVAFAHEWGVLLSEIPGHVDSEQLCESWLVVDHLCVALKLLLPFAATALILPTQQGTFSFYAMLRLRNLGEYGEITPLHCRLKYPADCRREVMATYSTFFGSYTHEQLDQAYPYHLCIFGSKKTVILSVMFHFFFFAVTDVRNYHVGLLG